MPQRAVARDQFWDPCAVNGGHWAACLDREEELRKDGEVMVKKISTEDNFADLLTKTHSTAVFQRLIGRIGSIQVKRQQRAMLLTVMAA